MNKLSRLILLIVLVSIPIALYLFFNKKSAVKDAQEQKRYPVAANISNISSANVTPMVPEIPPVLPPGVRPKIALIFDDLGENMNDIRELSAFKIPLTVSIIPGLRFSKNIANIAFRCGFDVLVHVPMEPEESEKYRTDKYKFISSSLSARENTSLARYYLGYLKRAAGANNHMGSKATQDRKLMDVVMAEVKRKKLFFIDSRTSSHSVACDAARDKGVPCARNEGFIDMVDKEQQIIHYLNHFIAVARTKGRIILIAHPKKNTFRVLAERISKLKKEVDFITVKEYLRNTDDH